MVKNRPTLFEQLQDTGDTQSIVASWRSSTPVRYAIIAVSVLLCAILYPDTQHFLFKVQVYHTSLIGSTWQKETVVADSYFPLMKPDKEYQAAVNSVRASSPPVFTRNHAAAAVNNTPVTALKLWMIADAVAYINNLPERAEVFSVIEKVRAEILRQPVISFRNVQRSAAVVLSENGIHDNTVPSSAFVDSVQIRTRAEQMAQMKIDGLTLPFAVAIISQSIIPTHQYDANATNEFREQRVAAVQRTNGIIKRGDIIIRKGDVVTTENIRALQSYGIIESDPASPRHTFLTMLGSLLHCILLYSIIILFLAFLRPVLFRDNFRTLIISAMIVLTCVMAWGSRMIDSPLALEYLIAIPVFSMLTAIYYDSRTAFTNTVCMALMLAVVRDNDYTTAFSMLIAGSLGAYSVLDLKSRTQIFRSIGFIAAGFVLSIAAMGMENGILWKNILAPIATSTVAAILSPLAVYAIIALVERYGTASTDLQLIEFDNLNHPLLLEMSDKAPGTYQHTLQLAQLVETAAYAIGANPLLARVGAYFHDIGKIRKAEYYIENQIDMDNKHDHLPPKKSASIIRNHIADGLELAEEYKLPPRVREFIPMHHGTSLIKHFYAKAVNEAQELNQQLEENYEQHFRYPGPKPNSKETALLMLADSIEAISRTVDDREELESIIEKTVREKIDDSQLDDCDLSLKELHTVKEVFLKNLIGAQHQRIQYDEVNGQDKR